jgi:hypothetical protein
MRRLVIALVVLVVVLVAADFGAAALAESAVSRQMREQVGLVDDPSVRINGFPFLTQAVAGEYSSIDVDATRISIGDFREVELTAHLQDVTAPLSMLLGSGAKTVDVAKVEGTAKVGANDLERLVPDVTKVRIETVDEKALEQLVSDGADESIAAIDPDQSARIVGTVNLLGKPVEVAVIVVLELDKGKATITPRDIRKSDGTPLPLPTAIQSAVLKRFAQPLDTGALPLQVTPTKFVAKDGTLQISGTASGVTLGGSSPTAG